MPGNKPGQTIPNVAAGSQTLYQNWEVRIPKNGYRHGYACIRGTAAGAAGRPGLVTILKRAETRDIATVISLAGQHNGSNARSSLNEFLTTAIISGSRSLQPPTWRRCVVGGARTDRSIRRTTVGFLHILGKLVRTCKLIASSRPWRSRPSQPRTGDLVR